MKTLRLVGYAFTIYLVVATIKKLLTTSDDKEQPENKDASLQQKNPPQNKWSVN